MRRRCAAVLALHIAGCSFFLPSPNGAPATERLDCGSRRVAPVVDTLMAIGGIGFGGLIIVADAHSDSDSKGVATLVLGLPSLAVGLVYAVAAAHGYGSCDQCDKHNAAITLEPTGSANLATGLGLGAPCHRLRGGISECGEGLYCRFDRCEPKTPAPAGGAPAGSASPDD